MTVLVAKVQFVCIGVQLTRTTGHEFALNALPQAPYSITAEALNSRSDLGLNVPPKTPNHPKAQGGRETPQNKQKKLTKNENTPKSLLLITDLTMDTVYFY